MFFRWFSYGSPMFFLWFSNGFPLFFLWFVSLWFSDGFPMFFLWSPPGTKTQKKKKTQQKIEKPFHLWRSGDMCSLAQHPSSRCRVHASQPTQDIRSMDACTMRTAETFFRILALIWHWCGAWGRHHGSMSPAQIVLLTEIDLSRHATMEKMMSSVSAAGFG